MKNNTKYLDYSAVKQIMKDFSAFNFEVKTYFNNATLDKETYLKAVLEFQTITNKAISSYQEGFKNKKDLEILKRIAFRTQYKSLMQFKKLFDEETFNLRIKSLINDSKININIKCNDNLYENVLQKEKYAAEEQKKKELRYQAKRDYILNVKKKNIYALPYFQEKKRRNAYNFNRSKKEPKKFSKKGKIHQK